MSRLLLDLRRALLLAKIFISTAAPLLVGRLLGFQIQPATVGRRLRLSFQRMGITYIKLGQFLAMRFDILPEDVCRELTRLFDKVPPMGAQEVKKTLEAEFMRPVPDVFADFEWACIAAASVAQVHRATTHDGRIVAVKVQRPEIARLFAADIRNFRRLARIGDCLKLFGSQSIAEAITEFERYTQREMDFIVEGRTAERLRHNARPGETAPRVFWNLTTKRVLTTEFIDGYPLSEIIHMIEAGRRKELEQFAPGLDLDLAVHHLSWACLRQLFVTGFFHADPHPGNIFLQKDGTVAFVDFGIFGQLTAERRETLASYIENLAVGNVEQSYRHFVKLLQPTIQTDMIALRRDIHGIMHRWHQASQESDAAVSERHLGTYFSEFIYAIRRNNITMSMDTLLFWRAILTLDTTALRLGSQFDLLSTLRDFFRATRPTPVERFLDLTLNRNLALTVLRTKREVPSRVQTIVNSVAQRRYRLSLMQSAVRPNASLDRGARLISSAIILGSLVILATAQPPGGITGQALLWGTTLSLATLTLKRLARR